MPTSATAAHGKKIERLVAMVAASATFAAACDPDDATDHVKHPIFPVDPETVPVPFPLAVVSAGPNFEFRKIATGSGNSFRPSGALNLQLSQSDQNVSDVADSEMQFHNFWGGVIADLVGVAGQDGNLTITMIKLEDLGHSPPNRHHASGQYWVANFTVEYGDT